jgi:hypothetical protein
VEKDEDMKAVDIIRSLMLKGHVQKKDFKKGAKIYTLQYGSYELEDPEKVAAAIKDSKKQVSILTKEGSVATLVFEYDDKDFPATKKSDKPSASVPVGTSGSNEENPNAVRIKEITEELIANGNDAQTYKNFQGAVSCALGSIQDDNERFEKAKHYLTDNAVLSWFFLTMNGNDMALVQADDLSKDKFECTLVNQELIESARDIHEDKAKSAFKEINVARKKIMDQNADKTHIVKAIHDAYEKLAKSDETIWDCSKPLDVKMLIDDLRHQFDDAVMGEDLSDAIAALAHIDWSSPKKYLVTLDEKIMSKSSPETVLSNPMSFVKSVYFFGPPLDKKMAKSLEGITGAGNVNPASITRIIYRGGKAKSKTAEPIKLKNIMSMLTKQQRAALKEML